MQLPSMNQLAWHTAITESWLLCEDDTAKEATAAQIAACDYLYFGDSHPFGNNDQDSASNFLEREQIPYLVCHCFYQEQPYPPRCEPCYFISQALIHKSIRAWCEDILSFGQEAFVLGNNRTHQLWMRNSNGNGYNLNRTVEAPIPMTPEDLALRVTQL